MVRYDATSAAELVARHDLPPFQAYVPGGMFLGWIVENDLQGPAVSAELAGAFRARQMTGPQIFERVGGVLDERTLGEHAAAFAADYFRSEVAKGEEGVSSSVEESPSYFVDFGEQFPVPTIFHVPDTWDAYEWIRITLVERYAEWRSKLP